MRTGRTTRRRNPRIATFEHAGDAGCTIEDVEQFCQRIRPQLVRALTPRCGDPASAEELAQETLLRAWQRWDHVGRLDSPEAWCHRVATNLSHSRWRRVRAESRALARTGPGRLTAPDESSLVDDRDLLASVASALTPREREVLALRHVADLSISQVAAALDQPVGTVTSTASRATAKIRAGLVAAALGLAGLLGASLLLEPVDTAPMIVDVTGGDGAPTVLPDGFAPCPATAPGVQAFCAGGDRIVLETGPHETLVERGTPLPVGPRTGYLHRRDDGRLELTVSDRTSSADLHYRVLADADAADAAALVQMIESIPAFARVTSAD